MVLETRFQSSTARERASSWAFDDDAPGLGLRGPVTMTSPIFLERAAALAGWTVTPAPDGTSAIRIYRRGTDVISWMLAVNAALRVALVTAKNPQRSSAGFQAILRP